MQSFIRISSLGMAAGVVALFATLASAQGVIVIHHIDRPVPLPRPIPTPNPDPSTPTYKITKLDLNGTIEDQVARMQVSQEFQNTGSRQMEVSFLFPLPYDGAIDSLTLMVDGKEFPAKLLEADKARSVYESIVRQNKDPALLEWVGSGMFRTSVFPVPAGASRKVSITYTQVLRKDGRLTDFLFPMSTAKYSDKPVEEVNVRLSLKSDRKIKSVYSPTHEIDIDRSGSDRVLVKYQGKHMVPATDFRLFFDTGGKKLAASVLTYRPDSKEEGYFLMLASPPRHDPDPAPAKKTVLFVVDRSGSMSGEKMEQAKAAARHVLNNLNEKDLFNIVAYDSDIESFRPELQKADKKSVDDALGFVDGLYAGGSTNIEGALSTAMQMVPDDDRPTYMLLLSDGRPTKGERNELKLVELAKKQNQHDARVINFGVGYDVNSRLMDRLSRACRGQSLYVRPDEDLEEHVARLYRKINAPVMTDVRIRYDLEGADASFVNRLMPEDVVDLFDGEQLIQVGRYKQAGKAKVTVTGKLGDEEAKFDFPASFTKKSRDQSNRFVEKIWAARRIGQIIDELDLEGENEELIQEMVRLSTAHGILTPYTSFLADENQRVEDLADAARGGRRSTDLATIESKELQGVTGISAFSQRALKSQLQKATAVPEAASRPANRYEAEPGDDRPQSFAGEPPRLRSRPAVSGYGGGLGGVALQDTESDEIRLVESVRSIGNKTLFKRNEIWVDKDAAQVDLKKNKSEIEEIQRFSTRYFELVARNSKQENEVLSQQQAGETLLVKLQGKYFLIR